MLREPKDYVSLQFVQIGTDAAAKRFLDELDRDYKGHQYESTTSLTLFTGSL